VEFTAQTRQTEWNLAYHLAVELSALLPDLDCDIDVLKTWLRLWKQATRHHLPQARTHESNYLVVELKRDGSAHRSKQTSKKFMRTVSRSIALPVWSGD